MKDEKKDDMSTAVTTTPAGGEDTRGPKRDLAPSAPPRETHAYKPGEGYATRLGMMVVVMAYVAFAAHQWYYYWVLLRDVVDGMFSSIGLSVLTRWAMDTAVAQWIAGLGAFGIAALGFFIAYHYIYVKPSTSEYMIKVDQELSKVTWPDFAPWFKPTTKVWGATYVVLIFTALLTLYVFGIDMILQWIGQHLFYGSHR